MPLNVRICGNSQTSELDDARALKEIIERDIPNNIEGEILIVPNATLFGQETKDVDLILIGRLTDYRLPLNSASKTAIPNENENRRRVRNIYFQNFCFVIETKHHRSEDVFLKGINLCVKYNNRLADVTTQSENQKYALKNFFSSRIESIPYICNFIWLRNVNTESLRQLIGNNDEIMYNHNYLPSDLKIKWLFQLACVQKFPYTPYDSQRQCFKNYSVFKSTFGNEANNDLDSIEELFNQFERIKQGQGNLTRRKIEIITRRLLRDQQYAQAIGEKLLIIRGRAGTGKTIRLLNIACDLTSNNGKRCLILTYNNALVSDIRRTFALADMPNQIDGKSINISTLHKYFRKLLISFGIVQNNKLDNYLENYDYYIKELNKYIQEGLIQDKDIEELMVKSYDEVAWDYVLIDESQDWNSTERDLIFKIFTHRRVIVADGQDQLVRRQEHCDWKQGLNENEYHRRQPEKRSLRQKSNLVRVVRAVADEIGVDWDVVPQDKLGGGKVIVTFNPYNADLHNREYANCTKSDNTAYEMLFLVPPSLVSRNGNDPRSRSFRNIKEFSDMGIKIWDGTNTDIRTEYSINLEEHRLIQYDSCRGLEGWCVICLDFDDFIRYKTETFKEENNSNQLALETFEERRQRFVNIWSLIPLTRAIDTLIITLKDRNSNTAELLRQVYQDNPDYIEWIE
ncbi:MAG: AAA family ATPase [Ignavibacteria bacterium]|nr:AAA family ATPase [Ignavibacteria bacterium]